MKRRQLITMALLVLLFNGTLASAQQELPLYPSGVPNNAGYAVQEIEYANPGQSAQFYARVSQPLLKVYLPGSKDEKVNSTALIIIPGGGYKFLSWETEGESVARAFVKKGFACFVLKYRLPSDSVMKDKSIGPLQDAQQAIKTVRINAQKWHIDTAKVGVIGYSAGGHLASSLGTHYAKSYISNPENISLRPDFMLLVYPVISMKAELTHSGSRHNLLGSAPSEGQVQLFSNETQVNSHTPPIYLTHTGDDSIVKVDNSIVFYQALVKNGVAAEMHLFAKGNHGFTQRMPVEQWLDPMVSWLAKLGF